MRQMAKVIVLLFNLIPTDDTVQFFWGGLGIEGFNLTGTSRDIFSAQHANYTTNHHRRGDEALILYCQAPSHNLLLKLAPRHHSLMVSSQGEGPVFEFPVSGISPTFQRL